MNNLLGLFESNSNADLGLSIAAPTTLVGLLENPADFLKNLGNSEIIAADVPLSGFSISEIEELMDNPLKVVARKTWWPISPNNGPLFEPELSNVKLVDAGALSSPLFKDQTYPAEIDDAAIASLDLPAGYLG